MALEQLHAANSFLTLQSQQRPASRIEVVQCAAGVSHGKKSGRIAERVDDTVVNRLRLRPFPLLVLDALVKRLCQFVGLFLDGLEFGHVVHRDHGEHFA